MTKQNAPKGLLLTIKNRPAVAARFGAARLEIPTPSTNCASGPSSARNGQTLVAPEEVSFLFAATVYFACLNM